MDARFEQKGDISLDINLKMCFTQLQFRSSQDQGIPSFLSFSTMVYQDRSVNRLTPFFNANLIFRGFDLQGQTLCVKPWKRSRHKMRIT